MSGIYLGLTYGQKVFFAIWTILVYVVAHIIARMKNKPLKTKKQQITYPTLDFDVYEYITRNKKQEFIGQNKVYKNELNRI